MPRMPLIDEDEEESRETSSDVNTPQGGIDEDGEDDDSPVIHSLAVKTHHPKGEQVQTDIVAMIHGPTGFQSKRIVIPGDVTAKRLGGLLGSVAKW